MCHRRRPRVPLLKPPQLRKPAPRRPALDTPIAQPDVFDDRRRDPVAPLSPASPRGFLWEALSGSSLGYILSLLGTELQGTGRAPDLGASPHPKNRLWIGRYLDRHSHPLWVINTT